MIVSKYTLRYDFPLEYASVDHRLKKFNSPLYSL